MDDRYKLGKKIGKGRAGQVYLAKDTLLGRTVAIRRFSKSRFKTETLTEKWKVEFLSLVAGLSRLSHPNILNMMDGGINEEGPFFITAYIEGKSLKSLIAENGFQVVDAFELASQLLEALIVAESEGFHHLALSHTSIIATKNHSGGYNYILLDLGHGKLMPLIHGDRDAWKILLQPDYIAPELYEGKHYGERSTQFILGNLLFGLLAGKHPFADLSLKESYTQHKKGNLGSILNYRVEVPKEFAEWLGKLLQPNVNNRFGSLKEALVALPERPRRFHVRKTTLPPKSICPDDLGFEAEE